MADPNTLEPLICTAIKDRLLMMFAYSDAVRVVEPHLCGVNSAGNVVLVAWMLPGYSRSDPEGAWRSFLLERMWAAQTLPQHFERARPGFNPADRRLQSVICSLPPELNTGDSGTIPAT